MARRRKRRPSRPRQRRKARAPAPPPIPEVWGTRPSAATRREARQRQREAEAYQRKRARQLAAETPDYIEFRLMDRYRSRRTGKIVPFSKRKGAIREKVQVQVDQKGRVLRTTGYNTREEVKRTVVPGTIHERGPYQGLVGLALDRTNVMTPSSLRGARKILFKVSGTDPRGERASFKFDIDYPTIKKRRRVLRSVMVGMLLSEMRKRSWRTWYKLSQVDWTKRHHTTISAARNRVPMRDVEIVVRVLK